MARPFKWKRVERLPEVTYFKPGGPPGLEEVVLLVEMEALRLKIIWVWNKRPGRTVEFPGQPSKRFQLCAQQDG